MAFFIQTPKQPSLGELLGSGISQAMQTGMQEKSKLRQALSLEAAKQQMKQQRTTQLMQQLGIVPSEAQGMQSNGMEEISPISPVSQEKTDQELTDQQIAGATAINPQLGNVLQRQKTQREKTDLAKQKEETRKREFSHKESKAYGEQIERSINSMPTQEISLEEMKDSILEGNLGTTSSDFWTNVLADYTGIESFRDLKSFKGAKFLAAQKSLFSELRELFPGQIRTAELTLYGQFLPQLGRSKAANLGVWSMANAAKEVRKARGNAYQQILQENGGYRPLNIQSQVESRIKDDVKAIWDKEKGITQDLNWLMKKQQKGTLFKNPKVKKIAIYDPADESKGYLVNYDNALKAVASGWRILK